MLVQDFLKEKSLIQLKEELGIDHIFSDDQKRVILNYSQIDSPKFDPIVRECRGLCLENGTWKTLARSFPRFFNYAEAEELHKNFDWNEPFCLEKIDGSLILFYKYEGKVHCNTRGSFAQGNINGSDMTWEKLIWSIVDPKLIEPHLDDNFTFACELVSLYNKVVRHYPVPSLYLLGIFRNEDGHEMPPGFTDTIAEQMTFKRPDRYKIRSVLDVHDYIKAQNDATFEGFVLRDRNGLRIKLKNEDYVRLHHLKGNDNFFLPKNLIPLVMNRSDEKEEILGYFPELKPAWNFYEEQLENGYMKLYSVWDKTKDIVSQKEFALTIKDKTPFTGVLFNARKTGKDLKDVWLESTDLIIKIIGKK